MPKYKTRQIMIQKIKVYLLSQIRAKKEKIKMKALYQIAKENQQLIQGIIITPTFMYEGKWYPAESNYYKPNKKLHHSLKDRVYKLVHTTSFDDLEMNNFIDNYVGKVLQISQHMDDLFALFPSPMHEILDKINNFNIGSAMGTAEVMAFKESNKKAINYLNKFFMVELLLNR